MPQKNGTQKEKSEIQNSIQIIGNVGRNPEQRVSRGNRTPFTILSVATRAPGRTPKASGNRRPTDTVESASILKRCGINPSNRRSSAHRRFTAEQSVQARSRQRQETHEHQSYVVADSRECDSQAESHCQVDGGWGPSGSQLDSNEIQF